MGNLGNYQRMTTLAKQFGGPGYLLMATLIAGGILYKGTEVGAKKLVKIIKDVKEGKELDKEYVTYTTSVYGVDNQGLIFKEGDTFRVLDQDGDAVLIEKIDDDNNPYFVSGKFLEKISEFEA